MEYRRRHHSETESSGGSSYNPCARLHQALSCTTNASATARFGITSFDERHHFAPRLERRFDVAVVVFDPVRVRARVERRERP